MKSLADRGVKTATQVINDDSVVVTISSDGDATDRVVSA